MAKLRGETDVPVIAIVGGGASGTLTAVHLLRLSRSHGVPMRVVVIDRYGRHGVGQAYATDDPLHLLNACADKMSAFPDDPGHLLRWARTIGLEVAGSDFLPRQVYGRYLCHVLDTAVAEAWPYGRLARVTGTASELHVPGPRGPVRVALSDGTGVDADAVVLATGNLPTADWPVAAAAGHRYIADPWEPGALGRIRGGRAVLVIGTGLTMIDVALTATRARSDAVVYAISRHGLLPRPHRCPPAAPVPTDLPDGPLRLAELVRAVRRAVRDNGGEWQAVVDGLRPHIPRLWARLGHDDQRRFLRSVARYWEVHRHRLPPAAAARIAELRSSGRLHVLRGTLTGVTAEGELLTARVTGANGRTRDLVVDRIVNASGPSSPLSGNPLYRRLFAAGLARPDRLHLGVDADEDGAVLDATGRPSDRIFTLGPPLRGLRYETTAIPEIRAQAAALAPRLLETVAAASSPRLQPGGLPR